MNKLEKHKEICEKLNKIYEAKNQDYGNSFSESFEEWGPTSAAVRMDDKMRRIKHLIKNDPKVSNERLEDSLLDIANYSIMLIMELSEASAEEVVFHTGDGQEFKLK